MAWWVQVPLPATHPGIASRMGNTPRAWRSDTSNSFLPRVTLTVDCPAQCKRVVQQALKPQAGNMGKGNKDRHNMGNMGRDMNKGCQRKAQSQYARDGRDAHDRRLPVLPRRLEAQLPELLSNKEA